MITAPRIEEIRRMNPEQRAELMRSSFRNALERAELIPREEGYSLALEAELFVGRYMALAGWSGEDGEGL